VEPNPAPASAAGREPLPSSSPATAGRHPARFLVDKVLPFIPALIPAAIIVLIVAELFLASGFKNFGWGYFSGTWNPPAQWGIAVFIVGSFLTATPALFLSMGIGLGIAIASTAYLPRSLTRWLDPFVDLLAGIPSVVYGIWGYILVAPYFGLTVNPFIYHHFAWLPGFGGKPPIGAGLGLPISIFILTLMALPITTLLIRDSLRAVPKDLWESGLALGATRWETMRRISIPHGSRGILSAGFLGFGRAFGETVAIAMVINLVPSYPVNFYDHTATMAATMFELLDSAYGNSSFLAALSEMALVLLAITLAVNILGRMLVTRVIAYEVPGL
jgi:phosphate transport system permease protein